MVERYDEVENSTSADDPIAAPDDGGDSRSCPVCEFASPEYNDLYGHLMTAHRKSTISEMLLETR